MPICHVIYNGFKYFRISLPEGIFALCSVGLLHGDKQVGELAVKELRKYEGDVKYGHHVAYLIAQFFIKKVNYSFSIKVWIN